MGRGFGRGWRERRRAVVGAAVSVAAALLTVSGSASAAWLPPYDLSPVGNSYGPQTVLGADGAVHVLWYRSGGGVETADHRPGAAWSTPLRLSDEGAQAGVVRPAVNASGDLAAVWIDSNGGQLGIRAATRPHGGAWTAPVSIAVGVAGQLSDPVVALAPDGTATAMWMQPDSATSLTTIRASVRPPGGEWSAPTTVSTPANHSFAPKVVVDREGTVTAVWYQATAGGINRVFAASRPANGAWTTPELLSINDWAGAPFITVAADGTLLAAWRAREPSLRYAIEVAVRPPGGSWSVRSDVDGGPSFGNNSDVPSFAIRRDGEITVLWSRQMGDWYRVQAITRAAGGDTWSAPVTISADGKNAFEPKVAYAPDGVAHAIWRRRNDVNYIVQASSRAADGSWAAPANLSAAATSSLELADLSLAFDGDGDPIVSWYRHDGVAGRRVQTTVDDTHGPRLDELRVPATAKPGQSLAFAVAAPVDTWSAVGPTSWSFGDGATATGNAVEHAFAAAGRYEVTVAATDALGNRSQETRTVTVTAPPVVEPPVVEPPVVQPPVVEPPTVGPPVVAPPVVGPSAAGPPRATPPSTRPGAAAVCRVPKLTGLTLATAKRRLRAADCRLGKVRYVTAGRKVGRVVRVSRKAGARLKKGTRVDLTVVRRPPG